MVEGRSMIIRRFMVRMLYGVNHSGGGSSFIDVEARGIVRGW